MIEQKHLNDLFALLRFPSVSTEDRHKGDMKKCADWIVYKFVSMGMECHLHETPGHPIVLARTKHDPAKKTVLIYGHYDVQPADPLELWSKPPFEPYIKNDIIYARGATDNKGQFLAHILGLQESIKAGKGLPVNVIFLVEGEEEIGSPNLVPFVEAHKAELACDVIVISDTGMVAPGQPTLTYSLRGIAALEVFLKGPSKDLHSGIYGGSVMNPITALSRLITTLHDEKGAVAVEGFYNRVQEIESWERDMWKTLPINDEAILHLTGSPSLAGEKGYSALERTWARPTAELNGITGGYQGQGTKTVLPSKASAKLTFRLVPGQDPDEITRLVSTHLENHCPSGVSLHLEAGHSGKPYLMDPGSNHGQAAQRALAAAFNGTQPVLIREGGSIPIVTAFKEILGVETLLLGLALPDCNAHSPDENFPVENFAAGIRLNSFLLEELAG